MTTTLTTIRQRLLEIEQLAAQTPANEYNYDLMLRTIQEKLEGIVELYHLELKRRGFVRRAIATEVDS